MDGPIQYDSKERVAYDLMMLISGEHAAGVADHQKDSRSYTLWLFRQCLTVVSGNEPDCPIPDSLNDAKQKL